MAANVKHLSADGASQITSFVFPDAVSGENQMPVKFGFQSVSDRQLNDVQIKIETVGQNDGSAQLRVAADTNTLAMPYGVTASLTAPGVGGLWGSTGTRGFRITAINAIGETIGSEEVQINIDDGTKGVVLSWTAIVGATGYKVYDTDTPGTYPASSLRATLGAVTTYTDLGGARSAGTPPSANTTSGWLLNVSLGAPGVGVWPSTGTRYYSIAAFDSTGEILARSLEASVNVDATSKPVTLVWGTVSAAAYYQPYRSEVQGLYASPAVLGGTVTTTTILDVGLATTTGSLSIAISYGIPPLASAFGTAAILVGDIAINQQVFYWVNRIVPEATPEEGNPRLGKITIKET